MARRSQLMGPVAIALGVGLAGSWCVGSGPENGDMAVYALQAREHALFARPTHAGFIGLLMVFDAIGLDVQLAADALSAGAAAVAVLSWSTLAEPRQRTLVAAFIAALVLPSAGFAEVDTLWFALVGLGVCSGPWLGGLALAAAATVSPTSLAFIPWIMFFRRDGRTLGALAGVVLLWWASHGGWWDGTRGIAEGWSAAPGHWLGWLLAPALAGAPAASPGWLLTAPALLAPGDVPGHWIVGVPIALAAGRAYTTRMGWRPVIKIGLALVWAGAALALVSHRAAVRHENEAIGELADDLGPTDRLDGPWSWRVRVAIAATGQPDGIPSIDDSTCPTGGSVTRHRTHQPWVREPCL